MKVCPSSSPKPFASTHVPSLHIAWVPVRHVFVKKSGMQVSSSALISAMILSISERLTAIAPHRSEHTSIFAARQSPRVSQDLSYEFASKLRSHDTPHISMIPKRMSRMVVQCLSAIIHLLIQWKRSNEGLPELFSEAIGKHARTITTYRLGSSSACT